MATGGSDSDFDEDDFDDDEIMGNWRERRMAEMKARGKVKDIRRARMHGEFTEITEDEFLSTVTASPRVIVHFYLDSFTRCKIMDKHLKLLAPRHPELKIVKIQAEKAPFFVAKLGVRVLPAVCFFVEGVNVGRQVGFDGLDTQEGYEDEFETRSLEEALMNSGMVDECYFEEGEEASAGRSAGAGEGERKPTSIRMGMAAQRTYESDSDEE